MKIREAFNYLKFDVVENLLESTNSPGCRVSRDAAMKILDLRNKTYMGIAATALSGLITGVLLYQRSLEKNSEEKSGAQHGVLLNSGRLAVILGIAYTAFSFIQLASFSWRKMNVQKFPLDIKITG